MRYLVFILCFMSLSAFAKIDCQYWTLKRTGGGTFISGSDKKLDALTKEAPDANTVKTFAGCACPEGVSPPIAVIGEPAPAVSKGWDQCVAEAKKAAPTVFGGCAAFPYQEVGPINQAGTYRYFIECVKTSDPKKEAPALKSHSS